MKTTTYPTLTVLVTPGWDDYQLIDSGDGAKLERFGPYTFVRPEPQAIWRPSLAEQDWTRADAVFHGANSDDQEGGKWHFRRPLDHRWVMHYEHLRFWAQATPFRHLGVFPEQASHWDWMSEQIRSAHRPVKVLNLFGYTGLSTLAAASAGASVTHVDASKKTIAWARENQSLSQLDEALVRWLIDDAMKFVQREARRNAKYDGVILDPPKFGRGPKGEVWKLHESLPALLAACRAILSESPLFVVLTAYAIRASALSLYYALEEMMSGYSGSIAVGEMGIVEQSAGRVLSTAMFARWSR